MKRHFDLLCELMHKARKLGIKLLIGTDTGNNSFTRYGELHAKELEIFVKYGGYTPTRPARPPPTTPMWSPPEGKGGGPPPAGPPARFFPTKNRTPTTPVLQGARRSP